MRKLSGRAWRFLSNDRTLSALATLAVLVLLAGLLHRTLQASRGLTALEGVSAITCDRAAGRVLVAARGEVWILDESGRTLGHLHDRGGERAALSRVSSIAVAEDGAFWVVEPPRHAVHRFTADGAFDHTVVAGPDHVQRIAAVLPLADGEFALADTVGHALRVYDADGAVLAERNFSAPNDFMPIDGGFALLETGSSQVLAFDPRLEPLPIPAHLVGIPFASSVFVLDTDDRGALYFNACPEESRCRILKYRPETNQTQQVAADLWLAGYDPRDPSFDFCTTSDGRVLTVSQTFRAIVEYRGTHDPAAPRPRKLARKAVASGVDTGSGLHISLFGDAAFRAWLTRGWDQRRVLERHLAQGRTGLGILLALLLAAYSGQRLLGASRRAALRRRLPLLWRQILHPDLPTMARAALPSFGAALLLLLIVLPLAARFGTIEVLVMVLLSNRWIRRLAPVENIASARSAATARRAFELQAGREAARTFPEIQAIVPEAASFAAPVRGKSSDPAIDNPDLEPDVGNIDADVFELVDLLEGRLHLIAFGGGRLIWFPCNFTGRPTGVLHVAEPLACSLSASTDNLVQLPGLWLSSVHPTLVSHLSTRPILRSATKLCEECGQQVPTELELRCQHYRDVRKLALTLTLVLPGLGHLVLRKYRRGRWLSFAAVLLLGRILYIALPMAMDTLPFHPLRLALPLVLLILLWWKSWHEVRLQLRFRSS